MAGCFFSLSITGALPVEPIATVPTGWGTLLLLSEARLDLPGYEAQEISAREFVLFNWLYWLPLDRAKCWSFTAVGGSQGSTACLALHKPAVGFRR